jgi:hypothetical protein
MSVSKSASFVIATAAAALFGAAVATTAQAADVKCQGVNNCKGQSACKTASNACKGMNSCNGQGFILTSAEGCKNKAGIVVE